MPLYSVIIAARNEAKHLPACLQAVAQQQFKDFEVWVINDGSTDATPTILVALQLQYAWLRTLHTSGIGLGAARNLGAQHARGAYLAFLDADDTWLPNKLEVVHQAITRKPQAVWLYHPVKEVFDGGKTRLRFCYPIQNRAQFFVKGNPFTPSAVVLQKVLFDACGGFETDTNQVEDLRLWLELLAAGHYAVFIPQPLAHYRVGGGVTSQIAPHLNKVKLAIAKAHEAGLVTTKEAQQFLAHKAYEVGRFFQKNGQFKEALRHFKRAPFTLKNMFWMLAALLKIGKMK